MNTKTKQVYYCDFCNKHGLSKSKMVYHEKICFSNPDNLRACTDCSYLSKKDIGVFQRSYEFKKSCFFCIKKEIFIYPPKVAIKGNMYEFGNQTNEEMPTECEFKTSDLFF